MNLMGKTLVFINFFFVLVLGGFLAIDFARRTNWKAAFENADAQLKIARNNTDQLAESHRKLLTDNGQFNAKLEAQERKDQAAIQELKNRWEAEKAEKSKAEQKANEILVRLTEANAESKRRAEEIANLGKALQARDKTIVRLEDDVSKYKTEAVGAQNARDNAQERSVALLNQVREQQKELARLSGSAGSGKVGRTSMKPPLNYVKGAIEKISPSDKTLVQLNVGSDHGLAEGNTMEVYRLKPNPEYLGTLVILDARAHNAMARLLPSEYQTRRVELRVGDEVASKLSR